MDEARVDRAMSRIEAALARIERAADSALERAGGGDGALRARVGSALAELDALIESLAT